MHKDRQSYNFLILKIIEEEIEKNPDLRFIQLLWKLKIITREDCFYEESSETYKKLKKETEND